MSKTIVAWVIISFGVMSLSACGFKLRGAQQFPSEYKYALIQGTAEFSALGKLLKQYLGAADIKTVSNNSEADMVLIVRRDEFKRRVLSVNASGGANEYELGYDLSLDANDKKGMSLGENMKVSLIRNYTFDPNNVLAKTDEEGEIKNQMQKLAVRQVLRQLSIRLTRPSTEAGINSENAPPQTEKPVGK